MFLDTNSDEELCLSKMSFKMQQMKLFGAIKATIQPSLLMELIHNRSHHFKTLKLVFFYQPIPSLANVQDSNVLLGKKRPTH